MPRRKSVKVKDESSKFKCYHCKARFETYEDAESHHNKSRHKNKDLKIISVEEEIEKSEKTLDDFEEDQDDDHSDPQFVSDDEIDEQIVLPTKRKGRVGRPPSKKKVIETIEVRDEPEPQIQIEKPTKIKLTGDELFYKCIKCEEWFDTYDDLMSHQIKDHDSEDITPYISKTKGGEELPLKSLTKYFCTLCSFETYTIGEVKLHRQDHEDSDRIIRYLMIEPSAIDVKMVEEATYECSECDVMPDILSIMDEHWKENHSNRPLKLSRIYADDKPLDPKKFPCDKCSLKFPFSNQLKLHKRLRHENAGK